ncbi:hypothetical protein LCGC14_0279510 [marine sediment metagenome]|uniref:Uncharacterized protein n=2 Tax=root TaxID=1 RepID=A0A7V1BGG3_9RHOB|nr:hypothetical protein [Sulfitobacter litoralis]HDY96681.1 hypothetical protein [Sulfitobacter litoralis]HDZ52644.1 hypothetical protein [Sulfitobacter litoralis]
MAKLKSAKHDAFARLLAQGWKQVPAYRKVYAPDGDCRAAASRLAKRSDVVELVKSIQGDAAAQIYATMGGTGGTLTDLGITPEWIAEQYRIIAAKARAAGDFKAATDSVKNIEKMVRSETEAEGGDAPKKSGGPQIEHMIAILAKLAAPTAKIVDNQKQRGEDSREVSKIARNRAHRAAARDEQ